MRRRDLLALVACEAPHAPVDEAKLNAFASYYNDYVTKLRNGQLSLADWKDVVRAWERLR